MHVINESLLGPTYERDEVGYLVYMLPPHTQVPRFYEEFRDSVWDSGPKKRMWSKTLWAYRWKRR